MSLIKKLQLSNRQCLVKVCKLWTFTGAAVSCVRWRVIYVWRLLWPEVRLLFKQKDFYCETRSGRLIISRLLAWPSHCFRVKQQTILIIAHLYNGIGESTLKQVSPIWLTTWKITKILVLFVADQVAPARCGHTCFFGGIFLKISSCSKEHRRRQSAISQRFTGARQHDSPMAVHHSGAQIW